MREIKIETSDAVKNIAIHKFIETPDRLYINLAAYDKNLSKIQSDNLGVKINNIAHEGSSTWIADRTTNYAGPQSKNMIGHTVVQLDREEYTRESGVFNGVIRDSKYPNIYHLICGTDKHKQLISVDELNNKVIGNYNFEVLNPSNNYQNYTAGKTEILTQTSNYIYILSPLRVLCVQSYGYAWMKGYQVTKIKKSVDVSGTTSQFNDNTLHEFDSCSVSSAIYHNHYACDKAFKVYESEQRCIVLGSTYSNNVVLIVIDKVNDSIFKRIIYKGDLSRYNPLFISESFVEGGFIYTYCATDKSDLRLVKINLGKLDEMSDDCFTITKCNIDLGFIKNLFDVSDSNQSYTCRLLLNKIKNKRYATVFTTCENGTAYIKEHVRSFELSDTYTDFNLISSETNGRERLNAHVIKLDENKLLALSEYGVSFYAFNKIYKAYKKYYYEPLESPQYLTKTMENRIFVQNKSQNITEIIPKSCVNVDLTFDKARYLTTDKTGILSVSVSNEYGDYLDGYQVEVRLIGGTFESGASVKAFDLVNGKIQENINITNNNLISTKVLNFRRNK